MSQHRCKRKRGPRRGTSTRRLCVLVCTRKFGYGCRPSGMKGPRRLAFFFALTASEGQGDKSRQVTQHLAIGDLWRFDLSTQSWLKVRLKAFALSPCPLFLSPSPCSLPSDLFLPFLFLALSASSLSRWLSRVRCERCLHLLAVAMPRATPALSWPAHQNTRENHAGTRHVAAHSPSGLRGFRLGQEQFRHGALHLWRAARGLRLAHHLQRSLRVRRV